LRATIARRAGGVNARGVGRLPVQSSDRRLKHMISHELWNALRGLVRSRRTATSAIIVTLALVLGVVTCIFSLVNAVILRPLPFRAPERLVTLSLLSREGESQPLPYPLYADFASQLRTVEGLASLEFAEYGLLREDWQSVEAAVVTTNLFDVLDAVPTLGRRFLPRDELEQVQAVILSASAWRRLFASDPNVVGREIRLSHRLSEASRLYTVVGVIPGAISSSQGHDVDVFIAEPRTEPSRRWWPVATRYVVGRVPAGRSPETVRTEAQERLRLWKAEMSAYQLAGVQVEGLRDQQLKTWRPRLLTLMVAGMLVLILACVNIGTLLVGMGTSRLGECGIRIALGASRGQLIRQLLLENLLIGLLGGGAGVWLAKVGLPAVLVLVPGDVPRLNEVSLDWRVLAFGLGASAFCGLLSGLLPAVVLSRWHPQTMLGGGQARSSGRTAWWNERVVALQFAMALALTTGTALAIASEWRLAHAPVGFTSENVWFAKISVGARVRSVEEYGRLQERLVAIAQSLPQVEHAAVSDAIPPDRAGYTRLAVAGKPLWALVRTVSGEYFSTLGMKLSAGRTLRSGEHAAGLAVVNTTFATRTFGRENVVGEWVMYGYEVLQVVGVVGDSREFSLREPARPTLYRFAGYGWSGPRSIVQYVVLKTRPGAGRTAILLRDELRRLDPDMQATVGSIDDRLAKDRAEIRFYSRVLLLFSLFTVVVAAVGMAALVQQAVSKRRHEMAIRMAVGATVPAVRRLLLGRAAVAGAIGLVGGVALGSVIGRLLSSALYDVSPADPAIYAFAALVLLAIMAAAAYRPIRTVTGNDVNALLRTE